ncbi:BMC domain-containing protein [Clostridium sp. MSJ-11]|uniref:BMC domain-containing protein n=1 Tax=Clostridium mobile TaxID=2841512 RepID=A0ABS6EFJ0_9CLOT|nr:BMC domain-containing protein [Clostridium mobile]MBU5483159.1 BMC domain-containing protein [Clostridium mobile]
MNKSIGAIEFRSISKGIEVSDLMVKRATVDVAFFRTICVGKFLVVLSGNEGEIEEAVTCGVDAAGEYIVDNFIINAVHPSIIEGLKSKYIKEKFNAIGIVETVNVCSGMKALNKILKSSNVQLAKLQIANTLGGKLVFIISGAVSDVEDSIRKARGEIEEKKIIQTSVIPSPDELILSNLF